MDFCSRGSKRLFEFKPCAWGQHEVSEIQTDRAEAKRQRRELESTGDDFEEFVALLDRIQYMKTNRMNFRLAEGSAAKVIETKSPWIPSFVPEDFCGFAAKDAISAQLRDKCNPPMKDNPASSYEEKEKQSFQPASHFNMCSSRENKRPAKSFDLNVEASTGF